MSRFHLFLLLGCLLVAAAASAHDPGLSTTHVVATAKGLEATLRLNAGDLPSPALARLDARALRVTVDGAPLTVVGTELVPVGEAHRELRLSYPDPGAGRLEVEVALLEVLPFGHRQYLSFEDERTGVRADALLRAGSARFETDLGAPRRADPAVRAR